MNKLKLIILLLSTFILVGCDINYDLTISKKTIEENINVKDEAKENRSIKNIESLINNYYPVYYSDTPGTQYDDLTYNSSLEYYTKNIKKIDNGFIYTLFYEHDIENYYDANTLKQFFRSVRIFKNNEDNYVFATSNGLTKCQYVDSLKVNITINDRYVVENNADSVNNNIYTWNYNVQNCSEKSIRIIIKDKDELSSSSNNNVSSSSYSNIPSESNTSNNENKSSENKSSNLIADDKNNYLLFGIILIVIGVTSIISVIIFAKIKKNNHI